MNQGLIPGRYAKALLEYAQESGAQARVYELMQRLAQSFASEPSLRRVLSNPFVSADDKVKLLKTAAGATDADTVFDRFLGLLVTNNRLGMAYDVGLAYMTLYRKVNNIYLVTVTSAAPLPSAEEDRLKRLIQRHLGDSATMEYASEVDPELIGGFTVKINNEKLDASVANDLKQLRLKLLSK